MADERIEAIRQRHEVVTHPNWRDQTDVGVLLAALDAALDENERLRQELEQAHEDARSADELIDSARRIAADLAAARERGKELATILREQLTGERLACGRYSNPHVDCGTCWGCRVRAALAPENVG